MSETHLPQEQPDKDNPTTANLRSSYAELLQAGHTLGPDDFHDAYHRAGFEDNPELKASLPSNQELTDHSLEALRRSSMPISPEGVSQTRRNILDHWATTGTLPDLDNGPTADAVTRQWRYTPAIQTNLQTLIPQLEGSADDAVSPKGARGRNQIMPDTARQYGFDPDRLFDRGYNNMARDTILDDLSKRYHGETAAILIAYNAGPGRADAWIKSGRDNSTLPDETQKYLRHADRLDDLMRPGRDAVYDPTAGDIAPPKNWSMQLLKDVISPFIPEPAETTLAKIKEAHPEATDEEADMMARLSEGQGDWVERLGRLGNIILGGMAGPVPGGALGAGPAIGKMVGSALSSVFLTPEQVQKLDTVLLKTPEALAAQAEIRKGTGQGRQIIAAASDALEEFRKTVNKGIPEFQDWLATKPGQATPFWQDAPGIMKLIDHIEGGAGGGKLAPGSPLLPVADAIRGVNQTLRTLIEQQNPEMENFIEDYYRHMWTDPSAADRIYGAGRQGSGASLKLRTIPTIAEGIQQGLTPRILDPIENTLHYASGMTNYLMANRVLEEGQAAGYVKYFIPGHEPEGWEALEGRSATKAVPFSNSGAQIMRAFAPGGYSRSYNSWVGGGFYEWPTGGPIYAKFQQASNFMTGMKLGLSGFHALNILFENTASAISNATGEMLNGEVLRGFRDMGWGVTMIGPGITQAIKGHRLQKAYLNLGAHPELVPSTMDEKLADLYAKVGGRAVGRGSEYGWNQAMNWGQAWQRGALAYETKFNLTGVLGKPGEETIPFRTLMAGPRLAGIIGHETGRLMSTITAPLFDKYIPKVKMAAWADSMSTWLRANPMANEDAILRQGRYLSDSMDDRFGELVQDNLFWRRSAKQTLNLVTVSVGWEFGTLRAAYRAAKEIGNLNFNGEYARWAIGYTAALGLASASLQYLLTGKSVFQTGMPIPGTYYTGGKTVEGKPEIGLLPGIQKDVLQWYHLMQSAPSYEHLPSQIAGYAAGKLNPFASMARWLVTNRDWKGDPIISNVRNPETWGLPSHFEDLMNYVEEAFIPIGVEMGEIKNMKPGTAIPRTQRLLGIRPAPEWLQDPGRIEGIQQHQEHQEIRKELRQKNR